MHKRRKKMIYPMPSNLTLSDIRNIRKMFIHEKHIWLERTLAELQTHVQRDLAQKDDDFCREMQAHLNDYLIDTIYNDHPYKETDIYWEGELLSQTTLSFVSEMTEGFRGDEIATILIDRYFPYYEGRRWGLRPYPAGKDVFKAFRRLKRELNISIRVYYHYAQARKIASWWREKWVQLSNRRNNGFMMTDFY